MAEALLELRSLEKSFGALRATDGVSLEIRAGEIHALIGPNGAGKSTLIGQIAGTLKPDAGEIRFRSRDITSLPVARRALMGLGRTFQVSSLAMDFSVLRNVLLAVQAQSGSSFRFWSPVAGDAALVARAMEALERVGLAARAEVAADRLSHGERRRLEVAIALAMQPSVLLLDEPMAGLGPEGAKDLGAFLGDLKQETAILLVEHDMDAVFALADRISVLVYGRIVDSGSVEEIRRSPVVREAYLGAEAC